MNNNHKEGLRWLKQSQHALKVARDHINLGNYSDACFSSQQCAEMAIKAFLYMQGLRGITGHSVHYLIGEAASFEERFRTYQAHARRLDRFYISTRYPDALPDLVPYEAFDDRDAKEAVQMAEEIYRYTAAFFDSL